VGEARPAPGTGFVDAHIHMYPAEVAAAPGAWGRAHGEEAWAQCVAPEGRRSLQGWADPGKLIADMDEVGIETCVMLGWYWEKQETCDLQNRWYLEWIRSHPGRLMGFAAVQPASGRKAVDALERALDAGLVGVGEILPQAQGFSLDDPVWRSIMALAGRRGVPITLHATDPAAGPAAGPQTPLADYVRLARNYPETTLILAHWGGGMAFRGLEDEELPDNIYFDTAASPLLYDGGVFRRAVDMVGAARIIYGSDYPLILYPKGSREPSFAPFLGEIASSGLVPLEAVLIMGLNMRRLLPPDLAPARKPV
jgi:predicted TIM-barrel fold metal-dependent hydrolase